MPMLVGKMAHHNEELAHFHFFLIRQQVLAAVSSALHDCQHDDSMTATGMRIQLGECYFPAKVWSQIL